VSHDDARERRLARTVGSHERVNLALVDHEVDAAQDLRSFGLGVNITQFK
jgi:hypothetical protein